MKHYFFLPLKQGLTILFDGQDARHQRCQWSQKICCLLMYSQINRYKFSKLKIGLVIYGLQKYFN